MAEALTPTDIEKAAKRVDTRSLAYTLMYFGRYKVNTLLGGTMSMRRAGTEFLPQFQHESNEHYDHRLNTSSLVNVAILTLNDWVGRPFSKPVKFDETTIPEIIEYADDIDLQGTDVGTFLRHNFETAIRQGTSHILVEYPVVSNAENRTLADDARERLRPYWESVAPLNVIFAYAEMRNNRETLTHLRIYEEDIEMYGFAERVVKKIKVYEHHEDDTVTITVYTEDPEASNDSPDKWYVSDAPRQLGVRRIPFFTFYASKRGFMMSDIPIEGLVDLNIEHWQARSEIKRNVSVANFPILSHKGGNLDTNSKPIQFGPFKLLNSATGEFFYLEHSGAAIAVGMKYLETIEDSMGLYGAEFLRARPGTITVQKTATQSAIEHAATVSPLQDISLRYKDWVETVIDMTAVWLGYPDTPGGHGSITLATDFSELDPGKDLEWLSKARELRDLGRTKFLEAFQSRGVLPEDFDYEANEAELAQEPLLGGYTEGDLKVIGAEVRRNEIRDTIKTEESLSQTSSINGTAIDAATN